CTTGGLELWNRFDVW
nr:immunoglobulin heavy chain junction region [Macaca mulatta]MOY30565.1 immunoglobulin heavy chain junction region [Macaca mulatta]